MIGIELQGPWAGAVVALIALYLLFAPIERLTSRGPPSRSRFRREVPTWMKVFFRGLGLVLLVLAALLLAPVFLDG